MSDASPPESAGPGFSELASLDVTSPRDLWFAPSVDPRVRELFYPHSLRVMVLAARIARRLGVDEEAIEVAAVAHDIGNAGIYSGILLKPGSLDPVEWTFVQAHCHVGSWVCRYLLDAPEAARYVRDHHERWDGTGYPNGLEGEAISLGGRLLSVADVFDTLAFESRPYQKKMWRVAEALDELGRSAGSQFDPEVVEEFIRLMGDDERLASASRLEESGRARLEELPAGEGSGAEADARPGQA